MTVPCQKCFTIEIQGCAVSLATLEWVFEESITGSPTFSRAASGDSGTFSMDTLNNEALIIFSTCLTNTTGADITVRLSFLFTYNVATISDPSSQGLAFLGKPPFGIGDDVAGCSAANTGACSGAAEPATIDYLIPAMSNGAIRFNIHAGSTVDATASLSGSFTAAIVP